MSSAAQNPTSAQPRRTIASPRAAGPSPRPALTEAGRSAEQHETDILSGVELRIDLGAFDQSPPEELVGSIEAQGVTAGRPGT